MTQACRDGDNETVKLLLAENGTYPLVRARSLLAPCSDTHLLHGSKWQCVCRCCRLQARTGKDGNTPLHMACMEGRLETVKLLTSIAKCEQEAANHHVRTPLHMAVIYCRPHIVRYLLSKFENEKTQGLDASLVKDVTSKRATAQLLKEIARSSAPINPDCVDFNGWTPMHYAVDNCSLACAKALVTIGKAK